MSSQPFKVLLIEDNPGDAALIEEYLDHGEADGFELEWRDRLASGVKRLAEGGIDVVLLDLGLPDCQGLATLEKILTVAPTAPILILTGLQDTEVGLKAVQMGAQDFLEKGRLTGSGVARALRYAIERRRAEDHRQRQDAEIRMLTEQLPALMWTTDNQLRITSSLGAGLAGLNVKPGELVGKTMFEYVGTNDSNHAIIVMHRRALAGENVITELDWQGRKFNSRIDPLRSRGDHIIGTIGLALDVTDQKQAEEDFRAAAEIQKKLLPKSSPVAPGWDIDGYCQPAAATGGDFFDYVRMRDGALGVVVADVSKHGFAPALIMASTRRSLRNIAGIQSDLGSILSVVNLAVLEDTDTEYFVTLFFAKLDLQARSMTYAGAGHEAFLFSPQGTMSKLKSTSLPLGIAEVDIEANPNVLPLETGEILLLLTDGLIEGMERGEGDQFGMDRIERLVQAHRTKPAKEIVRILVQAVRDYCLPRTPHDDMTVVVVKVEDKP